MRVGDTFVIHMDRESLGDRPMGKYDVIVTITGYEQDRYITWEVSGENFPSIGHYYGYRLEPVADGTLVTSIYDWSQVDEKWKSRGGWPIIPEFALKATPRHPRANRPRHAARRRLKPPDRRRSGAVGERYFVPTMQRATPGIRTSPPVSNAAGLRDDGARDARSGRLVDLGEDGDDGRDHVADHLPVPLGRRGHLLDGDVPLRHVAETRGFVERVDHPRGGAAE